MEWEEKVRGGGGEGVEVRRWILPETRQFLATWLVSIGAVSEKWFSSCKCKHVDRRRYVCSNEENEVW